MRRRPGKAKTAEEAEFTGVNEHSEAVFNAAWPSIKAFHTEPNSGGSAPRVKTIVLDGGGHSEVLRPVLEMKHLNGVF